MLPVGSGSGQIWLKDEFLCNVEYKVDEARELAKRVRVQRIVLDVPEKHCEELLDAYELALVLADGQRWRIPRPLQHVGLGAVESYVEV